MRLPRFVFGRFKSSSPFHRYAQKLSLKASKEGITVDELLARAKPKSEELLKKDVKDLIAEAKGFKDIKNVEKINNTSACIKNHSKNPQIMDLNSFVDVEKFKLHNRAEIELLWKARFLNDSNSFSGAMEAIPFSKLYINARKYPTFVLPLPHDEHTVELHYVQWSFVSSQTVYCLITSLAEYKLHNEYSHPHTTFMLHTDLADKGVVLTNSVVTDNAISTENAALLVLNLQRFYTEGGQKLELLKKFNTGDKTFNVDELIAECETL